MAGSKSEELAWLQHTDLNLLKNWGGAPQDHASWNALWQQYQKRKKCMLGSICCKRSKGRFAGGFSALFANLFAMADGAGQEGGSPSSVLG